MERRTRCKVLGTQLDVLDWQQALLTSLHWAQRRESRYVCHTNVHAVITGTRDDSFRHTLNGADLVAPDGMPLVWVMRRRGHARQPRLSGPDFMWRFCSRAADRGLGIYLYGGTPETLERLRARLRQAFPAIRIVGTYAPPFRPMSSLELQEIGTRINESGAHAVFVGLGCPKQECWMAEQRGRIHAVMFGVGAAFDYHAGNLRRAPAWMRRYGLEWLHRLISDPRRLWRRYLVTNSLFLLLMTRHALRNTVSRHGGG